MDSTVQVKMPRGYNPLSSSEPSRAFQVKMMSSEFEPSPIFKQPASPPNQSLTLHASRWIIYNSVLDGSAYNWVQLQSEEITALFPFKHLALYGPFSVLAYGLQSTRGVTVPFLSLMTPSTESWKHRINWSLLPLW